MSNSKTRNQPWIIGLILAVMATATACSTGPSSTIGGAEADVTTTAENVTTTMNDASTTTTAENVTTTMNDASTTTKPSDEVQEPTADFYDLVTVNGARLAYSCQGEGSPKVVIEHGLYTREMMAEPSEHWFAWIDTQLGIAEFTEVCVYGRRGVAGGDPVTEADARTVDDQVDDLVAFLDAMAFDEPAVIAGHSWGGAVAQVAADRYPDRVGALLLIESVSSDSLDGFPYPSSGPIEFVDLADGSERLAAISDLGDMPLTVLSAGSSFVTVLGTPDGVVPAGISIGDDAVFERWTTQQTGLAALSSDSIHTTLDDSGHLMQVDRPDAIIDAVREIVERIDN